MIKYFCMWGLRQVVKAIGSDPITKGSNPLGPAILIIKKRSKTLLEFASFIIMLFKGSINQSTDFQ